ncbi:MAG: trypsin-like serine protease [Desulfobacteraceae bacterium]|nr:trypsin-like serine protease [Desulfobacteraceae bacterium]
MAFTFNSATSSSTFADLFNDSSDYTWYQLWVGNSAGTAGNYVDTSDFNSYGKGWISASNISSLTPDYAHSDDATLWIKGWSSATGSSSFSKGSIDFDNISSCQITTEVSGDTLLQNIFTDENTSSNTWYRVWIGNNTGTSGSYLDTTTLKTGAGLGWVRESDLDDISYSPGVSGTSEEFWLRSWNQEAGDLGWEHWTITRAEEDPTSIGEPDSGLPHDGVSIPSEYQLDWVDNTEINQAPYQMIGRIYIDAETHAGSATGFLISPEHILTNAHVVVNSEGDFALTDTNDFTFYPGQNGTNPEGYNWSDASVQKYFGSDYYYGWPDDDLAIVRLDEKMGDTLGYFNLFKSDEDGLIGVEVQTSGYSSAEIDQDITSTSQREYYQWEAFGEVENHWYDDGVLRLSDSLDTANGASGSPVWYEQGEEYYCVGVMSGDKVSLPVAANLDTDSYNWILGVLQSDGYFTDLQFA